MLDRVDRRWLAPPLLAGLVVYAVYLAENPYPASGAGLYFLTVEQIVACGYCLPETIPYYTAEGVPFAYPPLSFYLLSPAIAAGADPLTVSRLLPGAMTVVYLVPLYLFVRDFCGSRPAAALATLLVAGNPQVLEWHISAGGVVRAVAFLLALWGMYVGVHLFQTGGRRWLIAGVVSFGLTVLTHPTYALFFAISYLLLWTGLDRSPRGLRDGAAVGVGGLLIASPWVLAVAATHGPEIFMAAAGTHGGVGGGRALLNGISAWSVAVFGGVVLLVLSGRYLLAAWLLGAAVLFKQPRFGYLVGSIGAAAIVVEDVLPWLGARRPSLGQHARRLADVAQRGNGRARTEPPSGGTVLAAVAVILGTVLAPAVFAHHATAGPDEATPEFLDDFDREAMAWASAETPSAATFVVLGDAAEWFPLLAHRTILVSPWGVEWRGREPFQRHLDAYENVSVCRRVDCVERWLVTVDAEPDYFYVPKGEYTVRGKYYEQHGLPSALGRSDRYQRAFENEGVVVFRRTTDS